MEDIVLTPAEFVALLNQTLEHAYPLVAIEGELTNFRISKNRWVYFGLSDEQASVSFFGTVYQLPGPLQDGLMVRATGSPRLHPKFGFSVNLQSILPVGEGSLKKAADLLRAKLEKEGLFAAERKRPLPMIPQRVGLITAGNSAAYRDFVKILGERWGGLEIELADVYVQGEQSPPQIVWAIEHFNQLKKMPEVLVITRGGGSAEDLASFNDERVVRAVAASRVPTLVAVGHEVDVSLAELAADQRASTPSNAAQLLVPDRSHFLSELSSLSSQLFDQVKSLHEDELANLAAGRSNLSAAVGQILSSQAQSLESLRRLTVLFDPMAALKRGYSLVRLGGKNISSIKQLQNGHRISTEFWDGKITSDIVKVENS